MVSHPSPTSGEHPSLRRLARDRPPTYTYITTASRPPPLSRFPSPRFAISILRYCHPVFRFRFPFGLHFVVSRHHRYSYIPAHTYQFHTYPYLLESNHRTPATVRAARSNSLIVSNSTSGLAVLSYQHRRRHRYTQNGMCSPVASLPLCNHRLTQTCRSRQISRLANAGPTRRCGRSPLLGTHSSASETSRKQYCGQPRWPQSLWTRTGTRMRMRSLATQRITLLESACNRYVPAP